jgi:hypothetical protein
VIGDGDHGRQVQLLDLPALQVEGQLGRHRRRPVAGRVVDAHAVHLSARRSSRESSGRITGYWLPKLARKSSVSLDWLVWLCKETPVRKPFGALGSRHRYEMVELAISAPSPRSCPDFTQYPLPNRKYPVKMVRIALQLAKESIVTPKSRRKTGRIPSYPDKLPKALYSA